MELLYEDFHVSEKGWREITEYRRYYYDRETSQVILTETSDDDNTYKMERIDNSYGRVLSPSEYPLIVRKKLKDLLIQIPEK